MSDVGADNYPEVVLLTQKLVQIPSENPTGTEEAAANFIFEWFNGLGVNVWKDEVEPGRFNVVAKINGKRSSKNLIFISHMDTVPVGEGWSTDPFSGEINNGRLYGRGSSDMKSGLAASMVAFKNIASIGIHPECDLIFVASVDEEGTDMKGALKTVETTLSTKESFIIAPEPTGLQVASAHKGLVWYRICIKGKSCHAGNPQHGVDAIHAMAEVLTIIKQKIKDLPYDDDLLGRPTVSFGKISGGNKTNIVSEECTAEIDVRLVTPMVIDDVSRIVANAINEGTARVAGSDGSFKMLTVERPPIKAQADSPLILSALKAIKTITGKDGCKYGLPAYTDASIIAAKTGGSHCISFGPGYLSDAHTINESVEIKQIILAEKIFTETIKIMLY